MTPSLSPIVPITAAKKKRKPSFRPATNIKRNKNQSSAAIHSSTRKEHRIVVAEGPDLMKADTAQVNENDTMAPDTTSEISNIHGDALLDEAPLAPAHDSSILPVQTVAGADLAKQPVASQRNEAALKNSVEPTEQDSVNAVHVKSLPRGPKFSTEKTVPRFKAKPVGAPNKKRAPAGPSRGRRTTVVVAKTSIAPGNSFQPGLSVKRENEYSNEGATTTATEAVVKSTTDSNDETCYTESKDLGKIELALVALNAEKEANLVPYQHLGLLDPAWNIPAPKDGEKTMKDFCSKFKIPRADRTNGERIGKDDMQSMSAADKRKKMERDAATAAAAKQEDVPENSEMTSRSGPIVEIINGEIVIRESSMIVGERRTTEEVDREFDGAIVVEDSAVMTATYSSFTDREKSHRWTVDETKRFYVALRQCGTDFTTMENYFRGDEASGGHTRTRKQLKNKYMTENKKNPHLIDLAMDPSLQTPMDLSFFADLEIKEVPKKQSSSRRTRERKVLWTPSPIPKNDVRDVKEDAIMDRGDNRTTIQPPCTTALEFKDTSAIKKLDSDALVCSKHKSMSPPMMETRDANPTAVKQNGSNDMVASNIELPNERVTETRFSTAKVEKEEEEAAAPPLALLPGLVGTRAKWNRPKFKTKARPTPNKVQAKAKHVSSTAKTNTGNDAE